MCYYILTEENKTNRRQVQQKKGANDFELIKSWWKDAIFSITERMLLPVVILPWKVVSLYFCLLTSKSADTDNNVIILALFHYRAQDCQSMRFWRLRQTSCSLDRKCMSLTGRISQRGFRNTVRSPDLHSVMSDFFLLFLIFSFFSKCQKSYKTEGGS